ncbi:MAG: hypothetical protein NTU53_14075 [Planctomycetota bacterium]|nr:hypothetical protein [Planctomycetota bacterium]
MALTDNDLKEFEDAQLRVRVPAYLRQQRKMMLFVAPKNRRPGQSLLTFSVLITKDREDANISRRAMEIVKPVTWMGVEKSIVRQGPATWVPNGYELLGTDRDAATGEIHHHDLTILFDRAHRTLEARVLGTGTLHEFERLCRVLIHGIQVLR